MLNVGFQAETEALAGDKCTALHLAAWKGHDVVAAKLIAAKANVNAADCLEWTPLHYAAVYGHAAIVDLLLHANASPNAVDTVGDTPAQLAEINGHPDIAKRLREWQPGAASK